MLLPSTLQAREMKGRVIDDRKQGLAGVTVALYSLDSLITGTVTGSNGEFIFSNIGEDDYILKLSLLGFSPVNINLSVRQFPVDLGRIQMTPSAERISEAYVVAAGINTDSGQLIVYPSQKHVRSSVNGVDILNKLALPQLKINPIGRTVSSSNGGSVQFCINGRRSTIEEVATLLPNDIIKIELEENPGVRYGDVDVLLNYCVKYYNRGAAVAYDGDQSITSLFGSHHITGKFNLKDSEFNLYYGTNQQFYNNMWAESLETFHCSEYIVERHLTTNPYKMKWFQHWGGLSYNLYKNNKSLLNINASFTQNNNPDQYKSGQLFSTLNNGNNLVTYRETILSENSISPSVNVYYQHQIRDNQLIAFDVVGTYIRTGNKSSYVESIDDYDIGNYFSLIEGGKYSIIAEGLYETHLFSHLKLTTGIRQSYAFMNNSYCGTMSFDTKAIQNNTYGYMQIIGKHRSLTYRAGIALNYLHLKQSNYNPVNDFSFTPHLLLSYKISDNITCSVSGEIKNIDPSLSQLSSVEQLIDSLQIKRGNPTLRPYNRYNTNARITYNNNKLYIGLYNSYGFAKNAIMGYMINEKIGEKDLFVHSYANHPSFKQWKLGLNFRAGMLWDVLQLSANIYNNRFTSNGINYSHIHNCISWDAQVAIMLKKFTCIAAYVKDPDSLWGELLKTGQKIHFIRFQYNINKINVGMSIINPFQKDFYRNENFLNKDAGNNSRYHINDAKCLVSLNFSMNLNWGRERTTLEKRIENEDTDAGIL